MSNQHLFNALQNVCGFIALETDMLEILRAVKKDQQPQTPACTCRQIGLKSWQTSDCPHAQELHNDSWVCTKNL